MNHTNISSILRYTDKSWYYCSYTPESSISEMMSIGFVILLMITLLFPFLLKYQIRLKKKISNPPGPIALPYLGCLLQMLMNKPTFRWIHRLMDELNTEIFCICLGRTNVYAVKSPEIACQFLKQKDAVFVSRPKCMAADVTTDGYLTTAMNPFGDQWKKMRRILSSELLSTSRHRWLHNKRVEEADHLIRYVYNQGGGIVNVRVASQHYCGNVIRKMIFGTRFFGKGMQDGGPGGEEVEHVAALFTTHSYLYSFCVSDYFPFLRRFDLQGHEKIIKNAVNSVRKYQDPLIDQRVQLWENDSRKQEEDLLDVLICLKDENGNRVLSAQEIKAQIVDIMLATVDNPSNAVEWAIAEMINQPEILKRATIELDSVVGRDRLVQESDIPHLNYVKACAKECFRLHPVAAFNVPHMSIADCTVAGYFIPQGSHVLLSRLGLGRNPKVWDEPLKFMPERHLNDSDSSNVVLSDPELKMLSFSTGRRGCVGVTLGSTMTNMLLARLLQGFTWSAPPNVAKIELTESKRDLALAKPLLAFAKPRLAPNVYHALN